MRPDRGIRSRLGGLAVVALVATTALPQGAGAQAPADAPLRERFEGTWVRVALDMPASEKGVDVRPDRRPALDYTDLAKRLKRYGTSVRRGDVIQVTKVKVKKDLVEFQLGGGGYGTFGDDTDTDASVGSAPKTQREKNLEQDLKREGDPAKRRRIQEELDQLRREREREDARNRAIAAEASESKKQNLRARAAAAGSRFNVRFDGPVPAATLEPAGLMAALDEWVDFDVSHRGDADDAPGEAAAVPPAAGLAALRKGLTRAETEALLGPPAKVTPGREGTLRVERLVFNTPDEQVEATFVEGVLVKYAVSSR